MQEKIFKIIKNHFSLDKPSLNRFKKLLFIPDIDEIYKNIIGKDLRYKVRIPLSNLEDIDKGWFYFKKYFWDFYKEYEIQYEDFKKNRILVGKNEHKLFKLLKSYYMKNKEKLPIECHCCGCCDGYLDGRIEEIGIRKIPDKKLYFVLSLNFADWLLCSSAESWTSCLNLNSSFRGCYWSGLPGLIVDKNRAMIYITDEIKKNWNGIEVDSVLSRSWVLLDKKNNMNYLKFFPAQHIEPDKIKEYIKLDIWPINSHFISKYSVDLLFHKHGDSCFIFQDLSYLEQDFRIIYSSCGRMQVFDKEKNYFDSTSISCHDGLDKMIDRQKEINNYIYSRKVCYNCDRIIVEDNFYVGCDGNDYCPDCFFEAFEICEHCGETYYRDDVFFAENSYFCNRCFDKHFFICRNCGETKDLSNVYDDNLCEDCYTDLYSPCDACNRDFPQDEVSTAPDGSILCVECYKKLVKNCCECRATIMIEDAKPVDELDLYLCKDCLK